MRPEPAHSTTMNLTGIIAAILSALLMGTIGVFSKITGLPAETITFFRLMLGACFMLLFLFATRQTGCLKKWPTWPVLINGGMLAGFIIFYVQAMNLTTMANAIMLVYLAPLTASIFAHFFLGERLNRASILLIGAALFGFAMMMEFKIDFSTGSNHFAGICLALVAMLCYAGFILINRVIKGHVHVFTRTFYQLLTGAVIMLPFVLASRPVISTENWFWLMGTGLFPGFLAILFAVIALSTLPAATFGTLAYFEPIAVILFGWLIFSEALSPLQIAGCTLILSSGIVKAWLSAGIRPTQPGMESEKVTAELPPRQS
ncbi:MAG: DMT family transporter [Desulfoprunum sp.]|nr:DMT family transporter [Desulfoprunum sp.]